MGFSIRLLQDGSHRAGGHADAAAGEIQLGEHSESFVSPIGFWTRADYEAQWRRGVERAAKDSRPSCLLTSIAAPQDSDLIRWWLLYPVGDCVFAREGLLIRSALTQPFDADDPYALIPPRERLNEDGQEISEWELDKRSLREFLSTSPM